jgi:type II secretory pathway component GspD/PulD (secretin)
MKNNKPLRTTHFFRACSILLAGSACLVVHANVLAQPAPPVNNQLEVVLEALPEDPSVLQPTSTQAPVPSRTTPAIDLGDGRTLLSDEADVYHLDEAPLAPLLRALARRAGLQVFLQDSINQLRVTGRIRAETPRAAIDDLVRSHGLVAYDNGTTLFVHTLAEVAAMPTRSIRYELRFLTSDKIAETIRPMLTPQIGIVQPVPLSNFIIIRDNDIALANILDVLRRIDIPRKGVNIQCQIYRLIQDDNANYGVDWSSLREGYGISMGVANSLDTLFNFDSAISPAPFVTGPTAAILRPDAFRAVLTLVKGQINLNQVSAPNLMLQDQDRGIIKLADRYPIITFQPSSSSSTTDFIALSSEIRYKIDESDPNASNTDPGRELGVSVDVFTAIHPDNTVTLKIQPRSAEITEFIEVPTGQNTPPTRAPRVSDAFSSTTVRVPSGMTVLLGGVLSERKEERESKVPILGDIPGLSFFFKSRETSSAKSNLIFAITPTIYDPNVSEDLVMANDAIRAVPVKTSEMVKKMRDESEGMRPVKTPPYNDLDLGKKKR